ncbi:glycosyltransferase family 2 protein [Nocardia sp. CS682]|uniref:glycosyltransferase n=1 Tax=Nocardia sp. CS682 TaxID=1047172 RepID=UPI00107508FE|nr:glycosyltransferase [Nocardia sp. CS682]QBS40860.1 glycosyl transferase [Nocardia sp. CS682]
MTNARPDDGVPIPRADRNDAAAPGHAVARIVVVVPVRNEGRLLPNCLAALARAAAQVEVPVRTQLVLDACTDESEGVPPPEIEVIRVEERNVGAARAHGFRQAGAHCGAETWFATTDADSQVDELWLRRQVDYARAGSDVVAGIVEVRDWAEHTTATRQRYEDEYRTSGPHGHVHGANLGFRADAYWRVGGFQHLRTGEDVDLVTRMVADGARIAWAEDVRVTTSARRAGRAPQGFAAHLRRIESSPSTERRSA